MDCIEAARTLGVDKEFEKKLLERIPKLSPQRIGQYGQLQEWVEDWDDPKTNIGMCLIYGVASRKRISPLTTPQLTKAALQSLTFGEGDKPVGVGLGRPTFTVDSTGNKAYEILSGFYDVSVLPKSIRYYPPFKLMVTLEHMSSK